MTRILPNGPENTARGVGWSAATLAEEIPYYSWIFIDGKFTPSSIRLCPLMIWSSRYIIRDTVYLLLLVITRVQKQMDG